MSFRISRDQMFMEVAWIMGRRSTCLRAKVGAVAVVGNRITSTGYVGAPAGMDHCIDVGCKVVNDHCIRTVHAEANVVAFAAYEGLSLEGAAIYSTHRPCLGCAKLLANAGVSEVVYNLDYGDDLGIKLLAEVEIELWEYNIATDSRRAPIILS